MATPTVWDEDFQCYVHHVHIADPSGGVTQDSQARAAIVSALSALRLARIIGRDATATVESQLAGATVYDATAKCYVQAAAISNPTGGTPDAELRTAVNQILVALREAHIIVGGGVTGPTVYDEDSHSYAFSAYTAPTGGGTVDDEGRAQANLIATAMRSAGLLTLD
jgi:hypothetical protein